MSFRNVMKFVTGQHLIKLIILKQVKKNKLVVYGAQAQNKRSIGPLRRQTRDYDIYSPRPKVSANKLEKKLDRVFGGDYFYVKQAEHPGTWKVKTNPKYGDKEVADFSRSPKKMVSGKINGVKYAALSMTEKDKRSSLRDPQYKFRHDKDRADLKNLLAQKKFQQSIKRKKKGGWKIG